MTEKINISFRSIDDQKKALAHFCVHATLIFLRRPTIDVDFAASGRTNGSKFEISKFDLTPAKRTQQ